MTIGHRLRALRKQKKLTQMEVAKKTGLLRCNVWRLENREAAPTIATLEKIADALEIPMFLLFYDYQKYPEPSGRRKRRPASATAWGNSGKDARILAQFCRLFSCMSKSELGLILSLAERMSRRKVV